MTASLGFLRQGRFVSPEHGCLWGEIESRGLASWLLRPGQLEGAITGTYRSLFEKCPTKKESSDQNGALHDNARRQISGI
jgi:hypothetical protein